MPDESIYRCINPACTRAMPRPVNFCPWCGAGQNAAARAQAEARSAEAHRALPAAAPPPPPPPPPAPPAPPAPKPAPEPRPVPPVPAPSAHAFGRSGTAQPGAAPGPGISAGPATPRQREPIRLRWWILALALLWGVWLVAKPSARKTEKRIDAAIELARDCKGKEAQDELIALRAARATPAQLERLQKSLNEEAAKCTRRRQRERAWSEADDAAQAALKAGNPERARTRLQAFVRRWGEDGDTRALADRIDAARGDHPLAAPKAQAEREAK
jgi:hypothetical protein